MIDFLGIFRIELIVKERIDVRKIAGFVNADQNKGIADGRSQLLIIFIGHFILFKFAGKIEIFLL